MIESLCWVDDCTKLEALLIYSRFRCRTYVRHDLFATPSILDESETIWAYKAVQLLSNRHVTSILDLRNWWSLECHRSRQDSIPAWNATNWTNDRHIHLDFLVWTTDHAARFQYQSLGPGKGGSLHSDRLFIRLHKYVWWLRGYKLRLPLWNRYYSVVNAFLFRRQVICIFSIDLRMPNTQKNNQMEPPKTFVILVIHFHLA